jgi:hypothetical protein
MFRRHAFFLFLLTVFSVFPALLTFGGPVRQEVKPLSDSELLDGLKKLREEMTVLKTEVEAPAGTGHLDRKNLAYEEYQAAFGSYAMKVEEAYRQLAEFYSRIDRLYRTNPNSPLYKQIIKEYLDAKAAFDAAKAAFGGVPAPETLRAVATVSPDRRLNDRVAASLRNEPREDRPAVAQEILQSDESRFIGTFDAVEMFLLVKGDAACYVLFGWKEQMTDDSGKKSQRYHLSLVRSEFFPVAALGKEWSAARHLEKALTLSLVPVDARGDVFNNLNQFLTRVKSYSRAD